MGYLRKAWTRFQIYLGFVFSVIALRPYFGLCRLFWRTFRSFHCFVANVNLQQAQRIGDPRALIAALEAKEVSLFEAEDYESDLSHLEDAVRVAKEQGDTGAEFDFRMHEVSCALEMGDDAKAIEFLNALDVRAAEVAKPFAKRKSELCRAQVLCELGGEEAYAALADAQKYALVDLNIRIRWQLWLGILFSRDGLVDEAYRQLSIGLLLAEELNKQYLSARIQFEMLHIEGLAEQKREEFIRLMRVFSFAYQRNWNGMLARANLHLAGSSLASGNLDHAEIYFQRALKFAKLGGQNRLLVYRVELGRIEISIRSGKFNKALNDIEGLLRGKSPIHAEFLVVDRAFALAKLGQKAEALQTLEVAEKLLQSKQTKLLDAGIRQRMAQCYVECGSPDRAEQSLRTAIEVWETVRLDPRVLRRNWGPWATTNTYETLYSSAVGMTLRQDHWHPERGLFYSELNHGGFLLRMLPLDVSRNLPDSKAESKVMSTDPLDPGPILTGLAKGRDWIRALKAATDRLVQLPDILAPGTALIEYFVKNDFTAAFVVVSGKPGVRAFRLEISQNVLRQNLADVSRFLHPGGAIDELQRALERLSERILAPLNEAIRDCSHLVVIPDKELASFPFQLLPLDGQPLLRRLSITFEQSAAMTVLSSSKSTVATERAAVFGVDFETEAKEVAGLLGAKPLLGDDVTIDAVAQLCQQASLVHFSCHSRPPFPAVAAELALGHGQHLTAREIMEWTLKPSLVVLSSCESGVGPVGQAGEVLSLVTAWMYAGATSVVASFWEAHNDATRAVMNLFYQRMLHSKVTKADALREAQLEIATNSSWQHPFYWAPFAVFGQGQ